MTHTHFLKSSLILSLLIAALATGLFAGHAAAQGVCTLSALSEVPAYRDPEKTDVAMTLLPGDGGQVMGQLKDGTYGVALGRYNVETLPSESLRWVDYSANIALKGPCDNLMLIPLACVANFTAPTNAYRQPDTTSEVALTFDLANNDDRIEIVGQQTGGWYATPDPNAPASVAGTLGLLWLKQASSLSMDGPCAKLPIFYPAPKLDGEICTVLTGDDGESNLTPNTRSTAVMPLPNTKVQILAVASNRWYGYDPKTTTDGATGESRLRWIYISDNDEIEGDCGDVPLINVGVKRLEADDSGSTVEMNVGDSVWISLPSEVRSGIAWAQTAASPARSETVLAQQGEPHFFSSSDRLGMFTFTFQAVGAGTTTIDLEYTSLDGAPSDAFAHTFTIDVSVLPARTLGE